MKEKIWLMFLICFCIFIYKQAHKQEPKMQIVQIDSLSYVQRNPRFYKFHTELKDKINATSTHHIVTVTVYNPVEEQCDADPLITADNSVICLDSLQNLKWCAVSRDLLEKYPYGSKILVYIDEEPIEYTVHDTMNKRFTDRIDLLVPENSIYNKWESVIIHSI